MKWTRYLFVTLLLGLVLFGYFRFYWVYEDGTKAGVLNTFGRKGYVWKTYEGKIIQSGFRANVQSNEFQFSVVNERVAKTLLENAGREVELHFKSYFGALPWRGWQKYIVDSVYQIRDLRTIETTISPQ
ncbi:MAG: hypothetical protein P0Y53_02095 [Candidatus Pseudobacter hemicellulosilyticus]|uniref:6-phosphogluconate dehydrogenase n=1 Tax=Candidatus Pseudobacter hemicellulosilyticus TaxID=3121375 RepID=A0AAJ5WS18_9BACT|nr:MAG: hypothetical protein P0Y53_02095 [Pseudobacter sp.]